MAKTVLVGNGLNRFAPGYGWEDIIQELATFCGANEATRNGAAPFTLLYEQLVLCSEHLAKSEDDVKAEVARLLSSLRPSVLHELAVGCGATHILTTNYDYTLEAATGAPRVAAHTRNESRYSLFRAYAAGAARVWHLHGEVDKPSTIALGHDQYVGYLTKAKNYLTSEQAKPLTGEYDHRSPFIAGLRDFETSARPFSWLDAFLRDDVHIVGFGLDYSEIALWWLLTYKRRLSWQHPRTPKGVRVGRTTYYLTYPESLSPADQAKLTLLRNLGVQVEPIDCGAKFKNAMRRYERIFQMIHAS